MRAPWLALALLACGETAVAPGEVPPVETRAWLEGNPAKGQGILVVQTEYDPGGQVDLPQIDVEGLDFRGRDPVHEVIGDREVLTQRYTFTGPKGSYEIGQLTSVWHGPDGDVAGASSPLFVDLQVDSKRPGEARDIVEPSRVFTVPWAPVLGLAGAGLLLAGGVWVAFGTSRTREEPEVAPEPPDRAALRAWEAVRHDDSIDDHDKAQALSRIFRDYMEQAMGIPAVAWTTTEILGHLGRMAHLPEGNVPRAKRLLRATDLVKFAEKQPGHDFFEDLDSDLRAFVGSTRPQQWGQGGSDD